MGYGASPEQWRRLASSFLLPDLLPVVSKPGAAISPSSRMASLGKTPSRYNGRGEVSGIKDWTDHATVAAQAEAWGAVPDYGICVQTRQLGAIDVDVPDPDKAGAIASALPSLPKRYRANSGKFLLVFRRTFAMPKRVIPVDGGMIEFLGDGQQFIAHGRHESGVDYAWNGDILDAPELGEEQLNALWLDLAMAFATGKPTIARAKREAGEAVYTGDDPVASWLADNWDVFDEGRNGELFIRCPFEAEHTTESGATSTAYFPAGTGGYEQGHFVCLHAHCAARRDEDYRAACGYAVAQFEDLSVPAVIEPGRVTQDEPEPEIMPPLVRDKQGRIEATADNLTKLVALPWAVGRHVAYDAFTDELVWADAGTPFGEAKWRSFGDEDTLAIRIELERRGVKPMGAELLRAAIYGVARKHTIDIARVWVERLTWDGVPRMERFAVDCWGWVDSPYARAVGRYVWTAMAGRVLQPGVQADMAPILVGDQGLRKTTALKAMVPMEDMYTEISLTDRDDNLSRRMRGKLVGELEELRGLDSRALEEIKAFITRQRESWVPKFKEFESHFWRRLVFFGSTNNGQMLNDPTGERRWLPGTCVRGLDIDLIRAWRDQLWAEGAFAFELGGVAYEDAERLAPTEHVRYKVTDAWGEVIQRWLDEPGLDGRRPLDKGGVTLGEVMFGALGIKPAQQELRHAQRLGRVLQNLGLDRVQRDIGRGVEAAYAIR